MDTIKDKVSIMGTIVTLGSHNKAVTAQQTYDTNLGKFQSELNAIVENKLADRVYNSEANDNNGMGHIFLVKDVPLISQIVHENTIYDILYDFEIGEDTLEMPLNCVLNYNGGSFNNGTIKYNDTIIDGIEKINNLTEEGSKTYLSGGGGEIEPGSINIDKLGSDVQLKLSTIDTINNTINASNPPLPTPEITISWTFYKDDGTTEIEPENKGNSSSPIIEKGIKAKYVATYKWVSSSGYQNPTSVNTTIVNWQNLPTVSGNSSKEASAIVNSDTTLKVELRVGKVGLIVKDGSVVPVSDKDFITSSASKSVTFYNRIFYGIVTSTDITDNTLTNLTTKLVNTNKQTITINQRDTEYFVYASTSKLTKIAPPNSPNEIGAFTMTEVNVTNIAGVSNKYYVYRSNNRGAYKGVQLVFEP